MTVSEDRTGSTISPNTSRRVMSNYEVLSGENTATIYSLQSLITPVPKPEDDPIYKDGIKLDPVEMVSIWLGRDYLNMILNLKVSTGKEMCIRDRCTGHWRFKISPCRSIRN